MIILTLNQVLLEADRDGADGFTFPGAVMRRGVAWPPPLSSPVSLLQSNWYQCEQGVALWERGKFKEENNLKLEDSSDYNSVNKYQL